MKVFGFSFLRTICVLGLLCALVACGGGGSDVSNIVPSVGVSATSTALVATETPPTLFSKDDGVAAVLPTTAEVLESLKVLNGGFIDSDMKEIVTVAPGQIDVTFTSFSRIEKYSKHFSTGNQAVTQLVFLNHGGLDVQQVLHTLEIKFMYGNQEMFPTAKYYIESWKTEKGNGLMITFYVPWHGQVPFSEFVVPFRLVGKIPLTVPNGTIELELIHVQTGNVSVEYSIDQEDSPRTIMVDPRLTPDTLPSGKG